MTLEDVLMGFIPIAFGFFLGLIGTVFFNWKDRRRKCIMIKFLIFSEMEKITADAKSLIEMHEKDIAESKEFISSESNLSAYNIMDADFLTTIYTSVAGELSLLEKQTATDIFNFYVSVNRAHNWKHHNQVHTEKTLSLLGPTGDRKGLITHPLARIEAESALFSAEQYLRALKEIVTFGSQVL